jgi:hypothetical protein
MSSGGVLGIAIRTNGRHSFQLRVDEQGWTKSAIRPSYWDPG